MDVRNTLVLAFLLVGCGSSPAPGPGGFPPRPEGCDVHVFPGPPPMQTDNIGAVNAVCGDDVSDADCERTLKDQACKLGGDVVWGVESEAKSGKKHLSGRAAHTKASGGAK
ncbi:MAG: hypothetical protein KF819_05535 [Labilithrix sp.]|nr:hypothetical protein [Labilithrix sp.]